MRLLDFLFRRNTSQVQVQETKIEPSLTEQRKTQIKALERLFEDAQGNIPESNLDNADNILRVDYYWNLVHKNVSAIGDSSQDATLAYALPNTEFNFIPDKVLPGQLSRGFRYSPSISHKNYTLFVQVREIDNLGFEFSDILDKIKSSGILIGFASRCCQDASIELRIGAYNGLGKSFKFENLREIESLKNSNDPSKLDTLARLYAAVGKTAQAEYLTRLATNKREMTQTGYRDPKQIIEMLREYKYENNEKLCNHFLYKDAREKIKAIVENIETLTQKRDAELIELKRVYGEQLTPETMAAKKAELISKYDPQIGELCERKSNLEEPARKLGKILYNLPSDAHKIDRDSYKQLSRAYRNLRGIK
jgi:hypothetical protein